MATAAIAVLWANSSWSGSYHDLWHHPIPPTKGVTLHHVINDGLMVIFFLVVGLEIKRELLAGELAGLRKAILPVVGAVGGMIAPAALFLVFNGGGEAARGWAIPTATDIAFALGALSLLGSRIPIGLKVFLTAFAIVDDLGAVLIIALFYTSTLNLVALAAGATVLALLWWMNRRGVTSLSAYLIPGILIWACILLSGIHATIAGVLLALAIPLKVEEGMKSPLETLEGRLHPWVAFIIMPVFALANAGVTLGDGASIMHPISMGVVAGLFVGKQIGVFVAVALAVRIGIASLPEATNWVHMYGASILGGIGFTMSLFVAGLAFSDSLSLDAAKIGILFGSVLSGIVGYTVLRFWTGPSRSAGTAAP